MGPLNLSRPRFSPFPLRLWAWPVPSGLPVSLSWGKRNPEQLKHGSSAREFLGWHWESLCKTASSGALAVWGQPRLLLRLLWASRPAMGSVVAGVAWCQAATGSLTALPSWGCWALTLVCLLF